MRRGRLAFAGVLLAAAMAGAAVTVAYGLATGFDRAARQADLPDVIVRFRAESRAEIDAIVRALPNVAGALVPLEVTGVGLGGEAADRRRRAASRSSTGPARLRDRRRARRRRARRTRS